MKYCKHCDKTFADGYAKCPYCSRDLKVRYDAFCPHCKHKLNNLSKPYCDNCGGPITIPGMRVENPAERIKGSRPGFFNFLVFLYVVVQVLFFFLPIYSFHDAVTKELTTQLRGYDAVVFFFTGESDMYTILGGGGDLKRALLFIALVSMVNLVLCVLLLIFDLIAISRRRGRVSTRSANMLAWSLISFLAVGATFGLVIYLSIFYRESGLTLGSFADYYMSVIWLIASALIWFALLAIKASKLTRKRDKVL